MRRQIRKTACCAAAMMLAAAITVYAEPDESTPVLMPDPTVSEISLANSTLLCDTINSFRAANGAGELQVNATLMEHAALRLRDLSVNIDVARARNLAADEASETIIQGCADVNTMLCSLLLEPTQLRNLTYSEYTKFGFAENEDKTLWVLLLTS